MAQLLTREMLLIAGDFREEAAHQQGIATLAAPPSITSSFVPPVLKALADAYPGIRVRMLVKESSKAVAEAVRQGEAEIGLLNFSGSLKDLNVTTLLEDELVAAVPASERRFAAITHMTLRELLPPARQRHWPARHRRRRCATTCASEVPPLCSAYRAASSPAMLRRPNTAHAISSKINCLARSRASAGMASQRVAAA